MEIVLSRQSALAVVLADGCIFCQDLLEEPDPELARNEDPDLEFRA